MKTETCRDYEGFFSNFESRQDRSENVSSDTKIAVVRTNSRQEGIHHALALLGRGEEFAGEEVLIKPNFNTADPFPASTHNDTLVKIIEEANDWGAESITVGERSGPPPTREVFEEKGIKRLAEKSDFNLINFDVLSEKDLPLQTPARSHWDEGFRVARPILEAENIVATCCLKTHRHGVFTMSLKLSVGIVPRKDYNYMRELHSSPDMCKMIAEINTVYSPDLIVMDAMEAFTDGGPATGEQKRANLIIAGTDRIGIDAVGLAVLKTLGSNETIMEKPVFKQDQIKRAVELDLGVASPEDINLIGNKEGQKMIDRIKENLTC